MKIDGLAVASEVASAGTALAGLTLVYIGILVSNFGQFAPTEKNSVRWRFTSRAWLAFIGMVLSLVAAAIAVLAKWSTSPCLGNAAVVLLLLAFAWSILVTVLNIREIR